MNTTVAAKISELISIMASSASLSGQRLIASDEPRDIKRLPIKAQGNDASDAPSAAVITKPRGQTRTPPMYKVLLLNDDFTPMEFVVHVLQKFFQKDHTEASQIMMQVHKQGYGIAGVFSFEIAETKVFQVNQYAHHHRHPLKCSMEKA